MSTTTTIAFPNLHTARLAYDLGVRRTNRHLGGDPNDYVVLTSGHFDGLDAGEIIGTAIEAIPSKILGQSKLIGADADIENGQARLDVPYLPNPAIYPKVIVVVDVYSDDQLTAEDRDVALRQIIGQLRQEIGDPDRIEDIIFILH